MVLNNEFLYNGGFVSKCIGIIPARMESSRFPGKPMVDIHGMPMIGHVYLRSKMSELLDDVYVATCNVEIFDYITKTLGGNAVMTSSTHERATDRTAEAIQNIEKDLGSIQNIVMIQGDEPTVTPKMIDTAIEQFNRIDNPTVLNLYAKITSTEDFEDENEIKVVLDSKKEKAIYFSREPIPNINRNKGISYAYKQVCIMPFKKEFLATFNNLAPTDLEKIESIDMLRLIENNIPVYMAESPDESYSVDNKHDLEAVIEYMKNDSLMKKYLK